MEKKDWELSSSAVFGAPVTEERAAIREIKDEESIYLTAPQAFEWNETDQWRVSACYGSKGIENEVDTMEEYKPEDGIGLIKYFNTEQEAIEFIKEHFKVDLSLDSFKKWGWKVNKA